MPFHCPSCSQSFTRTTREKHDQTKKHLQNVRKNISDEQLKTLYQAFKTYTETLGQFPGKIRLPNFPEHVSEMIIKNAIRQTGDLTVQKLKSGDLVSATDGKLECKCFYSTGPLSFSPSAEWNTLYVLDARSYRENTFTVFRICLNKQSSKWKAIKVNKNQTFEDQVKQKRRPRITWKDLYSQIRPHCDIIFSGSFQSLIQ